jgi:hypothetical protein
MMLNQIWEDLLLAMEKKLDPPMYQINDAVSGNGFIDTSAGGITILRVDKAMPNMPPTGKLFDIQDTSQLNELIDKIQATISNHFMIDRLINLNNDTEMTKGEAFLRNAIRQSTLRSIVSRLLLELFEVIINTGFMICLRRGKFGYRPGDPQAAALEKMGRKVKYLPDELLKAMEEGEDLYSIEYMTPAARDLLAEEGQGMVETMAMVGEVAAWDPMVKHRIDTQWSLTRLGEINGANHKMWRTEKEAEARIEAENQQVAQAQEAEAAAAQGRLAKDTATAQNLVAKQ